MKKQTIIIMATLAVAASLMLGSCGRKAPQSKPDSLTSAIDSVFTSHFRPGEPGAIVLVAKGDSIIYDKGFGFARLDTGEPVTDSTMFNICSISKQFSALALIKLAEEGRISLDDPLTKYFPKLNPEVFQGVTLRHMLSHTSGIPDARPRTKEEWIKYTQKHKSAFGTVRDFKHYALWKESTRYLEGLEKLNFEPGTKYEYMNPTYQLVLPIVEQVTGAKFTTWMKAHIFDRAGMENTMYVEPGVPSSNFAHAYTDPSTKTPDYYWTSSDGNWEECDYAEADFFPTKADGGLFTSAIDFLRYERALFGGHLIKPESLKTMTAPVIATGDPYTQYALGLYIEDNPEKAHKIYHTGDNGGFMTFEGYFPESELFYLIFANRADWERPQVVEAMDSIFAAHKLL